ncbi:MAG: hypothetical protein H6Q27_930, partial [Ignavibacteriaceae bacterium]|nr:hypothetical protein [Ignavibacteriaceae bacterium]
MRNKKLIFLATVAFFMSLISNSIDLKPPRTRGFSIEKDLLLVQFDCKTDVDDIHSAAALATLLSDSVFSKIHYHAVAGTYGIQEGLYVPPNDLFQLAFGDNWTDAHNNFKKAVEDIKALVKLTLENQGDIWIAEAGQSDFSAELIRNIQADLPQFDIAQRIHVVQHSDWNEKVTSPENLHFVKQNTDYHKIPDGNEAGNGTPGFRSPEYTGWRNKITDPRLIEIWNLAISIGNKYNGKDGRY